MENQRNLKEKLHEIFIAQSTTIFTLAKLAEFRDEDTGAHLERVMEYCRILVKGLHKNSPYRTSISENFIKRIQTAAPLHDIGKLAIPDKILLKPGKLTKEEYEIMKTHTIIGAETLMGIYNHYPDKALIDMGIEVALHHHERFDGNGYPHGLSGSNIPLSARIVAVADVYDSLRSDRCYRKGSDHEQSKEIIIRRSGTHFDPEVVKAFIDMENEFRQSKRVNNLKFRTILPYSHAQIRASSPPS